MDPRAAARLETFIALSWPAVAPSAATNRGEPNTALGLGATAGNGG